MKQFKQSGLYSKYPTEFSEKDMWELGKDIPSWLSDSARISSIKEDGTKVLDMQSTNTGDYVIKNQLGGTLVVLPKDGYLIYSQDKGILGINKNQLNILYEEKKGK